MITKYIKCPQLIAASRFLSEREVNEFISYLESRRYSERTITCYLSSVIHYFSWRHKLNKQQPSEVTETLINSFLARHLNACHCPTSFHRGRNSSAASLRLWQRTITSKNRPRHYTVLDKLLAEYEDYLKSVVGLVSASRQARCRYARELIVWLRSRLAKNLEDLTLENLAKYVYQRSAALAPGSITAMVSALGCFVSYLASNGYCDIPLPIFIPRPKPEYVIPVYEELTAEELKVLLRSFNRDTAIGKRDYAMACCLIELGLRTCDTARLSLDFIDWHHKTLTLEQSKNRRQHRLPMSDKLVGALIDYVQHGRPQTTERKIFVYHRAPLGLGVSASTVRGAIRRGFIRAGIPSDRRQLHRFRHTMATNLLKSGASIKSIADALGHQSLEATNRYTHVNMDGLRKISMPWPQGGDV